MMSCILQHDDMIRMLRLSMTNTFQAPFRLTESERSTSFNISIQIHEINNFEIKFFSQQNRRVFNCGFPAKSQKDQTEQVDEKKI